MGKGKDLYLVAVVGVGVEETLFLCECANRMEWERGEKEWTDWRPTQKYTSEAKPHVSISKGPVFLRVFVFSHLLPILFDKAKQTYAQKKQ